MKNTIIFLFFSLLTLLKFTGCGLIVNHFELSKIKTIDSNPQGASFTVYDIENSLVTLPKTALFTLHNRYGTRIENREIILFNENRNTTFTAKPVSNSPEYIILNNAGLPLSSLPNIPLFDRFCIPIEIRSSQNISTVSNETTPLNVKWDKRFSHIIFEIPDGSTQTASLQKNKSNPGFWLNFLGIGTGVAIYFMDSNVQDDAGNRVSNGKKEGLGIAAVGVLSLIIDIYTNNTKLYSDKIVVDFLTVE